VARNRFSIIIKRSFLFAGVLLALQLTSLLLGIAYQSIASADERRRFPAPGRLVDVGGYRLHIYCTGPHVDGQPTVVFEGGLGAASLVWALVQPEVAQRARACSYDRAGYAWSDAGPGPRTARQIAAELHRLLEAAGETGPYLLVGHSLGGIIIRVYAAEYPQQVSGLLLEDARHEDFFTRMPPDYRRIDETNLRNAQILSAITPIGATRLLNQTNALDAFEDYLAPLSVSMRDEARVLMLYNAQHWVTSVAEREASLESYQQARDAALPDGLPLLVLTAENGVSAWKSADLEISAESRETWMALQKELTALSSNSRWVVIPTGGHYIHLERPQVLVDAIFSMLAK